MGEYSPGDANFPRGGDGRPTYSPSEVGFREDGRYDSRFSLHHPENLVVIAIIVLAVIIVERLISLLKRRAKQTPAAPQGTE